MLISVRIEKENQLVKAILRTEDIMMIYEDPYYTNKTKISFYIDEEDMTIEENFKSFSERFSILEEDSYSGDDFGDDALIHEINTE